MKTDGCLNCELWVRTSDEQRVEMIRAAKGGRRSLAWIGPYRWYQYWLEDTRDKALAGDFEAYLQVRREFYCTNPGKLLACRLSGVYIHELADLTMWNRNGSLQHAINRAVSMGTWRRRGAVV